MESVEDFREYVVVYCDDKIKRETNMDVWTAGISFLNF